jgi:4-amino-4-deoxy-L-arabinose transferase-like glycosyltransferase
VVFASSGISLNRSGWLVNVTRKGWLYAIGIMLVTGAVYAVLAGSSSLWDRDEGWFTRPVVEMVESGDYLVPRYNGEVWTDKPILTYWVQAASTQLFGRSELAFRLPEIIGIAATCLLTFAIAARLVGAAAGLWAMAIMASSLMAVMVGTLATSDGVLMPFITGAMAIYVVTAGKRLSAVAIAGIGLAVGVAALAKGPMGFLPVVAMVGAVLLGRKHGLGGWRMFVAIGFAAAIGIAVFLAWAIPANNASGGAFLDRFIGREVWYRATSAMEGHGGDFFKYLLYYIPVIIAGFFPWTLHLPGAVSALLGGRLVDAPARAILLGWMVPIVALMSLAATKLPHYIVFIWPAMAVAVGAVLVAAGQGRLDERDRKWLRGGVWFFGPVVFGMAGGLIVGPWFVEVQNLKVAGAVCGIVLLATGIVAVRLQLREKIETSAKVVLAGMVTFMIACALLLVPAIETVKITPSLSRAICQKTGPQVPVAAYRFHEPSMFYYIGRHIEKIGEGEIGAWARQDAPGVLVITKTDLTKIESIAGPLGLETIADVKGFNYSKGKWTEVLALERKRR